MGYAICRRLLQLLIAPGLQVLGIVATGSFHFRYANLSFIMLVVVSLWRPGGPCDDLVTLGNTTKDILRSRSGFFLIFDGFRDLILKAFQVPWIKKGVFVHACFQVSFSDDFGV